MFVLTGTIGNAGFRAKEKTHENYFEINSKKYSHGSSFKNFEFATDGINDGSNSDARRFGSINLFIYFQF